MRIHILSDIHNEFGELKYTPPECDVVILAGDIHPGVKGLMWAAEMYGDTPVISVAGNHEFWGKRRLLRHEEKMREKAQSLGVHFLQNESIVIGGVRFLGCTLWTDLNLMGKQPIAMVSALTDTNDYKRILMDIQQPLLPYHTLQEHKKSMEFLTDELNVEFTGKTVVVTHHSPSEQSCISKFRGDPTNYLYATNLDRFVEMMEPALWCHGHIHQSNDYVIGNTRIICNPRGYHGLQPNPEFDPGLVVDI